ncbi:MAG: hypothetical protein GW775_02420 [Candidatus Magasanikbacteria bacterium]|nr:hypothetical protein [Candidatus Magasanikbacteria bacterium]
MLLLGGVNIFWATKSLIDPKFAKKYMAKSPKAWVWKKIVGEERALKVLRIVFAPIGIVVGIILLLYGLSLFLTT